MEREKVIRDIETVLESLRFRRLDLSIKQDPGIRRHIDICEGELTGLHDRLAALPPPN